MPDTARQPAPAFHCRVLPPVKFKSMIQIVIADLSWNGESFMTITVTVFAWCCNGEKHTLPTTNTSLHGYCSAEVNLQLCNHSSIHQFIQPHIHQLTHSLFFNASHVITKSDRVYEISNRKWPTPRCLTFPLQGTLHVGILVNPACAMHTACCRLPVVHMQKPTSCPIVPGQ